MIFDFLILAIFTVFFLKERNCIDILQNDSECKVRDIGRTPVSQVYIQKHLIKLLGEIDAWVISSLLLSGVLALLLYWVGVRYGLAVKLISAGLFLSSRWLFTLGRNYFHMFFASFLPMVATFYAFEYGWNVPMIIFLTILLKFFLSGFEFILPVMLSVFVPLVYFSLTGVFSYQEIMNQAAWIFISLEFSAVLWGILLLSRNAFALGFANHLNWEVRRWTTFFHDINTYSPNPIIPQNFKKLIIQELSTNRVMGIKTYQVALVMVSIAAMSLFSHPFHVAAIISVLCPLSWVCIMQTHAALHFKVDPFCWEIPFIPMVLISCAILINDVFRIII